MTFQHITLTDQSNGILTITLNRPDKLNALNASLLDELADVIGKSKDDPLVKGIILTGAGEKAFCAGADLKQLAELTSQNGYEFARHGQSIFRRIELLDKPVICAVNGYAFGGGCELAMSTHLRIASTNAQFCQPEVKLGILPGYGGTQRLARLVGKGRALDLCLTARTISAEMALNWGLVTEVTTQDKLLTRAQEILNGILSMAPKAITSCMRVIDSGFDLPLPDALELEASYFGLCCATRDKQEGVAAFLEKRPALFAGE